MDHDLPPDPYADVRVPSEDRARSPLPPGRPGADAPTGGGGFKRQRSPSRGPPDERGNRPPHGGDRGASRDRGYDRERHDRERHDRSPQRRRFDDRGSDGRGRRVVLHRGARDGRGRGGQALSFREFCLQRVTDDATPAECEQKYEQYRREHADAFRRKEFDRPGGPRDDPAVREAHDPRKLAEPIKQRAEMAALEAGAFARAVAKNQLELPKPATREAPQPVDPEEKDDKSEKADAMETEEDAKAEEKDAKAEAGVSAVSAPPSDASQTKDAKGRWPVPPRAWSPARLARDLRQLASLVSLLDAEKGVVVDPGESARFGDESEAPVAKAASDDAFEPEAADAETLAAAVDRRLVYCWRVHGVDYYAAAEMSAAEYLRAPPASRDAAKDGPLARGPAEEYDATAEPEPEPAEPPKEPKEEEGDETRAIVNAEEKMDEDDVAKADEKGEEKGSAAMDAEGGEKAASSKPQRSPFAKWASRVDRWFSRRVTAGDPAELRLGHERVERELEAWKRSCVIKHAEERFGCTLSAKQFVAEEFVMKHINTKQAAAVDAQRERILDQIFLENYLQAAREEEKAAKKKANKDGRENAGREGGQRKGGRGERRDGRGGRGGRGGREFKALAAAIVAEGGQGAGGARVGGPRGYADLDAQKPPERVVLDYGDI